MSLPNLISVFPADMQGNSYPELLYYMYIGCICDLHTHARKSGPKLGNGDTVVSTVQYIQYCTLAGASVVTVVISVG